MLLYRGLASSCECVYGSSICAKCLPEIKESMLRMAYNVYDGTVIRIPVATFIYGTKDDYYHKKSVKLYPCDNELTVTKYEKTCTLCNKLVVEQKFNITGKFSSGVLSGCDCRGKETNSLDRGTKNDLEVRTKESANAKKISDILFGAKAKKEIKLEDVDFQLPFKALYPNPESWLKYFGNLSLMDKIDYLLKLMIDDSRSVVYSQFDALPNHLLIDRMFKHLQEHLNIGFPENISASKKESEDSIASNKAHAKAMDKLLNGNFIKNPLKVEEIIMSQETYDALFSNILEDQMEALKKCITITTDRVNSSEPYIDPLVHASRNKVEQLSVDKAQELKDRLNEIATKQNKLALEYYNAVGELAGMLTNKHFDKYTELEEIGSTTSKHSEYLDFRDDKDTYAVIKKIDIGRLYYNEEDNALEIFWHNGGFTRYWVSLTQYLRLKNDFLR